MSARRRVRLSLRDGFAEPVSLEASPFFRDGDDLQRALHYRNQIGFDQRVEWAMLRLLEWQRLQWQVGAYLHFKYAFDRLIGLLGLIASLPILLVCAVIIKRGSKGPVFFSQWRVGRDGRAFRIFKLRTMTDEPLDLASAQPFDKVGPQARVTPFGLLLRDWKLDELPQFWNVFIGDMSIVGPRPFSIADSLSVPLKHWDRYALKPGLTGLWQARYSTFVSFEVKLRLDCEYVRLCSPWLDLKLMLLTVPTVLKGERAFRRKRGDDSKKKAA